jgi:hypothetical protein
MSPGEWLHERTPGAPHLLRERMAGAVADCSGSGEEKIAVLLRNSAAQLVDGILTRKDASRGSAIDLLAADALITYSCEAACDDPDNLVDVVNGSIAAMVAVYSRAVDSERELGGEAG